MDRAELEGSIQAQATTLIIKLDMLQWPFDVGTASRILHDTGYAVEQPQGSVSATKPDGQFFMDRPGQTIRFDGISLNSLVAAKDNFESQLERSTGVVLGDLASYYQYEYILIYLAKRNLHDALDGVYDGSKHMECIREIVGRDVRPFLVDVSSRGTHDSKAWFRVRIEPKVEGTDRTYFCSMVCRDASIDKMIGYAKGSDGVLRGLLRMLESDEGGDAAAQDRAETP